MKEAQMCAMVVMLLMSLTMATLIPRRVTTNYILNRSRWLIFSATTLMGLQFLLQYSVGFRSIGITQAVMVNLIFFIPCSWLIYLAILNLQKRGKIQIKDWMPGMGCWLLSVGVLAAAVLNDGQPLLNDTKEIRLAERIVGIAFTLLQSFYALQLYLGNVRLKRTLRDYYDRDIDEMLQWMGNSSVILAAISITVPFFIFSSGLLLLLFSTTILLFIYYLCVRFYSYCWSNASQTVEGAQQNESDDAEETNDNPSLERNDLDYIDIVAKRWVLTGAYQNSGVTMPDVAAQIGVSQRHLREWYQSQGFDTYSDWLQRLRIDYAKQLLADHPEYSLDAIAQQCGFSSRSYFYKVFQKLEKITPAQYSRIYRN